jgi:hypothetical protein
MSRLLGDMERDPTGSSRLMLRLLGGVGHSGSLSLIAGSSVRIARADD